MKSATAMGFLLLRLGVTKQTLTVRAASVDRSIGDATDAHDLHLPWDEPGFSDEARWDMTEGHCRHYDGPGRVLVCYSPYWRHRLFSQDGAMAMAAS